MTTAERYIQLRLDHLRSAVDNPRVQALESAAINAHINDLEEILKMLREGQ